MPEFTFLELIQHPVLRVYIVDNNLKAFREFFDQCELISTVNFLWNFIKFHLLEDTANFQYNYYFADWLEIEEVLLEYQDKYVAYCPLVDYNEATKIYFVTL